MSEATFNRGMKELVEKGFVAATPSVGWYWINPDYLWNGDRLAFVKEYRKAPSPGAKKEALRDPNTIDLVDGLTDAERQAQE